MQVNAPTTNVGAPTRNLQSGKDKYSDQHAKKRAIPCSIHVLPLLNLSDCKQLILKIVCMRKMFCVMLESALYN